MVFKILSTLAVFLFGTVWAFRNLRAIFEKVNEVTGVPTKIKTTTESGTKLTITTANSLSNSTSNTSTDTGA